MKYILLFYTIITCNLTEAQSKMDEVRSPKHTPFKNIVTRLDTIGGILTIKYPKNWKPDPHIEENGSHFYRSATADDNSTIFFKIDILWMDNPKVVDEAKSTIKSYTGENGSVVTTQVDKRDAAYCFYKQTSVIAKENNLTFKYLFINGDNKVLVTFKTAFRNDISDWKYKPLLEDIEDSIHFLKIP